MFEELRKKALKNSLFLAILLIVGGLVLAGWNTMNFYYVVTGYADFEELEPGKIRSQLVEADITANFGYYLYEYEFNKQTNRSTTTDYYYVIWTGDENSYMTIKVPASYGKRMEEMSQNTANGLYSDPITFKGKIKKLNDEEYTAFKEYFEEAGFTQEEIDEYTLPYYINCFTSNTSMDGAYVILFCAGVGFLIWGIVRLVKGLNGSAVKEFRKAIAAAGFTESAIETDYRSAFTFDKKCTLRVGRLMTYYVSGPKIKGVPNKQIMWAYLNTITHKRNGITTGTTYNVILRTEAMPNGHTFTVPSESVAQDVLQKMNEMFPWVVVGYSEDLKKMFNKDRAQFLQMRYNSCEHVAVEPGMEGYSSPVQQ